MIYLRKGSFSAVRHLFRVQEVFVRPLNEFVSLWWTFGGGTKLIVDCKYEKRLLCAVHGSSLKEITEQNIPKIIGGFPANWKLGWKVGGTSTSSGVSNSLDAQGTDGRYSWSSTLSLSADQWRKAGSVSCEASLSGQSPVTQTLDPDHC
uniref:Ig-like domain-containing protein n=1 Tax=Pundamilia nyererei TaxID=303518 RepID=A0A3B4FD86_9CICH